VGAALQRRDLALDQVMAEYRAYCAGELWALRRKSDATGGVVEYFKAQDDPAHCAICFVRAGSQAVVPLAVGHEQAVRAEFDALDRRRAWEPLMVPVPVAVVGGREYPFKPARGRHLLGVVQLGREAVLLAAAEDRLFGVLVGDGAPSTLPLGRPRRVRDVDVDAMRALARPFAAARQPDEPLRASGQTRAHHIRIVAGRRVELDDGPSIDEILAAMFADIEARATTPQKLPRRQPMPDQETAAAGAAPGEPRKPKRPRRPKLKGKTKVRLVLTYLLKMALTGSRDLVGTTGTIIEMIRESFSDFEITGEAFADVLKLIAATGTCLLAPHEKGERIWRIHLEGLCDPTSALHRRLCRETRGRVRVEEAAVNQRSALPEAPAAGEPDRTGDSPAASGDATTDNASLRDPPTLPPSATPSADRSMAQAEPVRSGSAGTAQAEALAIIRQLSTIPGAGQLLLLGGHLALTELASQAARRASQAARDVAPVEAAGAAAAPVEQAPRTDDEAPANHAVPVEEAPAAVDEPGEPGTAGRSATEAAGNDLADADNARTQAGTTPHTTLTADAVLPSLRTSPPRAPRRDAVAPRPPVLTPVQPEPRDRELGTLGPRGPPTSSSG